MFTEEELESLVPRKIFERGMAYYYEDDAVGRIQRDGNVFAAKVRGTETYRVRLEIRAAGPPKIQCDCPYDYGDVCKHGIALGLAVLDLLGEEAEIDEPAPPARLPETAHALATAWDRTTDHQKLTFLRQLLVDKPKQLRRFLKTFAPDVPAMAARPVAKPKAPPVPLRRVPRRPLTLTLTEQAQQLLAQQRGPELLPLLLSIDWLQNPPAHDSYTLPYLLREAARFQPEATFDAVMERFEGFLENKALRTHPLYRRLAACLQALDPIPDLTRQVQLFASEMMQQYPRLHTLREHLGRAGFAIIIPEEATDLPRKRSKKQPAATVAPPPKRRGRQPKKPA